MNTNRRQILRASLVAAAMASPLLPQAKAEEKRESKGASSLPAYNILDFGAKPGKTTLNTKPIQSAINAASTNGGGVVCIPPGDYLSGTLVLRQNVTLYLEAGATIWGSGDRGDYPKGSLIYAKGADNIAICGRGVIDGNGTLFWTRVNKPSGRSTWVANKWRPEALATFIQCTNLLLENVTFRNSPAWHIHPRECDLVTIQGISILAGIYENDGPNTDGIDPDACSRLRISDCYIQTGDDSIVIKCTNGPSASGGPKSCRDITVTNCVLISSDAALKIGTETHGEFRNIAISNCVIRDASCGIELWMRDGGMVDGCIINNISMTLSDGGQPIFMTQYPRHRRSKSGLPVPNEKTLGSFKNVMISNVDAFAGGSIFLQGMTENHLQNITLTNIRLHVLAGRKNKETLNANPPYPFLGWDKHAPWGIYCRYVSGLKFQNVQLIWEAPEDADWGSAIRCRSVNDVEINNFTGRQSSGSDEPVIHLLETKDALIHNCWAAEGSGNFLGLGKDSQNVSLMNNDLHRARKATQLDPGSDAAALFARWNRLSDTGSSLE